MILQTMSTSFDPIALPAWQVTWWDAAVFSLGCSTAQGPHCWLFQVFQVPNVLTDTERNSQAVLRVCMSSAAGTVEGWLKVGSWSISLPVSVGLGHGGWGLLALCLPDPFLIPPALAKPSQNFLPSRFFEYFTFLLFLFFRFISYLLLLF